MPPGRILLPWMPLDAEEEEAEDPEDPEIPEDAVDAERQAGEDDPAGALGPLEGVREPAGSLASAHFSTAPPAKDSPAASCPAADSVTGMAKYAVQLPDLAPGSGLVAGDVGHVPGQVAGDAASQAPAQHPELKTGQQPDQKLDLAPLQEAGQQAGTPAGASEEGPAEAGGLAREAMEQTLAERRGGPVRIVAPQNARDNRLVDIATANAREEARLKERGGPDGVLARIGAALGLAGPPSRIECVDVSHTGGSATRVGLVVWVDGLHQPEASRAYALEGTGGDDYKALYAWAGRRIESGPPWPDLLLVDGGRGQIAAVARGLAEHAGQAGQGQAPLFPLAGIAKARDEQGHADRRAGNVADRIFLPGRSDAVAALREGSPELLLLQNVRDSAHRFAISRHRRARGKAALQGELTRLPGIGPATARLLWDAFGSIEAMRRASLAELEALPGIGPAKAKGLHARLHGDEPEGAFREARRTSPRQGSGQSSGQSSGQGAGQAPAPADPAGTAKPGRDRADRAKESSA
ncbi:MAG: hypothetical protein J5863_00090 [Desulfovibrio sp.]|nr:hypothetical protein [Desulfovibrio sp.]